MAAPVTIDSIGDDRRQDGADLDQEHDGVAHHVPRVEHDERSARGHPDQRRLEERELSAPAGAAT